MEWCIKEEGFSEDQIEFFGNKMCTGNGYFGYRGTLEEYEKEQLAACTVSEVFDDNGNGWREPVNVPNGLYTYVTYQGKRMSVLDTEISSHVQELHMDLGMHRRKTEFLTEDGNRITVEAKRFVSLADIHLLAMQYEVTGSADMEIEIHTGIDKEIWNINGNHFRNTVNKRQQRTMGVICETIESGQKVAVAQGVKLVSDGKERLEEIKVFEEEMGQKGKMMFIKKMNIRKEKPIVMEKYVAICKETDCRDVWQAAVETIEKAEEKGFSNLAEEQKQCWGERYKKLGFRIKGDETAEQAVFYSCYLLYSSAPSHTDRVAIPARGLSGQVYKGAMFWDTEIYMLPMFAFCEPQTARNLMMYRVHNLKGALEKAAEYGYRGAFYPWESQENGKDGCTHYNLTDIFTGRKMRTYFRDKQIHISADVVYGLWRYMRITKDYTILLEGGAEVILECARFFYSYAYYKKDKGRYEFLDVTGADEYHERINNDAYTNYMISLTAKTALETMRYLEKEHPEKYTEIMDELDYWKERDNIMDLYEKIYLPKPDEREVIEQFDGYFKQEDISVQELYSRIIKPNEYLGSPCGLAVNTQIIKQADVVLLLSLFGGAYADEVKEKNWSYYEPRTEHGSSLSTCIYALLAAQIGRTEWAYEFLMKAAQIDLAGNYKLYLGDLYIGGTHPAANGGTWMVVVLGFAGLEVLEDGIRLNPHLPKQWEELEFCFQYAGGSYRAVIGKREIRICAQDGGDRELKIETGGKIFRCRGTETLKILY